MLNDALLWFFLFFLNFAQTRDNLFYGNIQPVNPFLPLSRFHAGEFEKWVNGRAADFFPRFFSPQSNFLRVILLSVCMPSIIMYCNRNEWNVWWKKKKMKKRSILNISLCFLLLLLWHVLHTFRSWKQFYSRCEMNLGNIIICIWNNRFWPLAYNYDMMHIRQRVYYNVQMKKKGFINQFSNL